VYTLVAARFLLGLSQAGAYPTAALLVKRWVPDRNRGLASSIVAFGGRFGGAGANWLTGILIVAFVPISTPATVTPADVISSDDFISYPNILHPSGRSAILGIRAPVQEQLEGNSDPERIAEVLNAVIRTPDVFDKLDWSQLSLSNDGKQLLAKSTTERTPMESERLNRLVLEKGFPHGLQKLHVGGWRPTLLIYGLAGIVVGFLFWLLARNWPRQHPWANEAEVKLIEEGQSKAAQDAGTDSIPWGELVRSRNQWLFSATNFFSNVGWVFLITLMPRYLDEKFQVPVDQRGLMTTIPLFVAAFGLILGGWCTDYWSQRFGRRWGRAIPMGAFKFPCALALLASVWLPTPWAVVAALAFMSVCQDFGIPAVWAFAQDTGGKQVGAVIGWGNMWGNFGAGLSPPLLGFIAKQASWDAVMVTGAAAFVLCGITGMLCNAAEPLFRERTEAT
jgi:nitrate/nitrite transporter NarK